MTLPSHKHLEPVDLLIHFTCTQDIVVLSHHTDETDETPGYLGIGVRDPDDADAPDDIRPAWLSVDDVYAVAGAMLTWARTVEKMRANAAFFKMRRSKRAKEAT